MLLHMPPATAFFEFPAIPLSPWNNLLLLATPGIWLLARAIVAGLSEQPARRAVILPGLFITIWFLGVHLSGLITESFQCGLIFGTLGPAILGVLLRKHVAPMRVDFSTFLLFVLGLAGACFLIPGMMDGDFHDKVDLRCSHFSTVNSILNGFYPPRDPVFPNHTLNVHYGVGLMASMVATLGHIRFDYALDTVSFFGFAYAIICFGALGGAIFGKKAQFFTAFIAGFHGGFPWFLGPKDESYAFKMMSLNHNVESIWLMFPSTSTLFQMPFSLGYPLGALTLLLASEITGLQRKRLVSLALLLVISALSVANITVFLTVGGSLLGYFFLLLVRASVARNSERRWVFFVAPLAAIIGAFLLATIISGFSSIILKNSGDLIIKNPRGIAGNLPQNLLWNWGSFGFLLPAAIPGFFIAHSMRIFFLIHAFGCLYILNFHRYIYSPDIVKFAMVGAISLAIMSSGFIAWLWQRRLWTKPAALLLIIGISAPAITFHIPFWQKIPQPLFGTIPMRFGVQMTTEETQSITWLRSNVSREDVVLRAMPFAILYPATGGLPVLQPDHFTHVFNNPQSRVEERRRLAESSTLTPNDLRKEGIRWIVVNLAPQAADRYLNLASQCVEANECSLVTSFGSLSIYKVL